MRPRTQGTADSHRGLAVLLAALAAVGPFSIDAYLPSIPEIGRAFGAPSLAVQQTLTAYMAPFAFMTLWHGAISDALGRRSIILVGQAIFALASVGCACAWSLQSLLFFRALQGLSAGAGVVVGRAIVRDLLDGPEAQRLMSHVSVVFALAPAVAPVLGGWLHVWFGWRSVFVFLVVFAGGMGLWCWRVLPETLPAEKRQPFRFKFLARSYWRVMTRPAFLAASLAITLTGAGLFIYIMSAPVFLLEHLHVSETGFLWLFGPATSGIMTGAWLSGRLAGRWSRMQTIGVGAIIMAVAVVGNVTLHLLLPPGLPWSVLPIFLFVTGMSLALPSLTLLALDQFPEQRGLAASCQSFLQTCGNAVTTAVVAPLAWGSALRLASGQALLAASGIVAVFIYLRVAREKSAVH